MITPEIIPFAKTGGLADMTGSLATALEHLGVKICVVIPAYRSVLNQAPWFREVGLRLEVPVSDRTEQARVLKGNMGNHIPVYAIRADRYFDRENLYGTAAGDYSDNAERFVFFSRAALQLLAQIDAPHVIHCHDWQSALSIAYLKAQPDRYFPVSSAKTVMSVHNLGYQGLFPSYDWHLLSLNHSLFGSRYLEFYGHINFLKAGLVFADTVATVSPTYAEEIKTPEFGFGLDGVFRERAATVVGILNGADYSVWNPATDRLIARNYDRDDLYGKGVCKADIQRELGLAQRPEVPLFGVVSRLVAQKGCDLLAEALPTLLAQDLQFVLLGSGDRYYQEFFAGLPATYPGRAGVRIGFDEVLAHRIEAGADMFLMPSRYEPSGLNQIYSLKYGTIPIVRATGGLRDSVGEFDAATESGTGFLFGDYNASALLAAIDKALTLFSQKPCWSALMRNTMAADFSWDRSARAYLEVYNTLRKRTNAPSSITEARATASV
jgi:starch synthase